MECKGRLLMVSSWFSRVSYKTVKLEVHAMETSDGTAASEDSWVRVKGIGGHALFVGDACSRAFPADAPTQERYSQDKIEDNQVCFVEDDETTISPLRHLHAYRLHDQCAGLYLPVECSAQTGRWHCHNIFLYNSAGVHDLKSVVILDGSIHDCSL